MGLSLTGIVGKSQFPKTRVVSMGWCNTGGSWCATAAALEVYSQEFQNQGLSRALIQAQGYFVQVRLREARQIGFLGQVLSEQPIGVLVRAALPGTLRITKIDFHIGGYAEALVLRHLQPTVPS